MLNLVACMMLQFPFFRGRSGSRNFGSASVTKKVADVLLPSKSVEHWIIKSRRELAASAGAAIMFVVHDPQSAASLAEYFLDFKSPQ